MTASSSARSPLRAIVLIVRALALAGRRSERLRRRQRRGDDRAAQRRRPLPSPETAKLASGAQLFSDNCESCHGPDGTGGHVGPDLQKSSVAEDLARVEKQVRNGGGAMPPFSGVLSDEEIDAVAHYVVEQIAPKG